MTTLENFLKTRGYYGRLPTLTAEDLPSQHEIQVQSEGQDRRYHYGRFHEPHAGFIGVQQSKTEPFNVRFVKRLAGGAMEAVGPANSVRVEPFRYLDIPEVFREPATVTVRRRGAQRQ